MKWLPLAFLLVCIILFLPAFLFIAPANAAPPLFSGDTIPAKATAGAQAVQKAAKGISALPKKIISLLKFRKNTQKKQQEQIDKTLAELNLPDSITISALKIRVYIDSLASNDSSRYQQLSVKVDNLLQAISALQSSLPPQQADASGTDPNQIEPEDDTDDKIIAVSLASKEAETTANSKDKRQALSLIRQIAVRQQEATDTSGNTSHSLEHDKYTLRKKAEICGYYNANSNFDYRNTDFRLISTIIYDSLYTTNRQGSVLKLKSWQNDDLIQQAKKSGCALVYTILFSDKSSLGAFLSDRKAIEDFAEGINALRQDNYADGININFANLAIYNRDLFTEFINYLNDLTKRSASSFRIYITLPVYDVEKAYDVASLSSLADRFCISFTSNLSSQSAPLAPLNGKQHTSMSTSVSYYLNQQAPPDKFILNFGYEGVKWLIHVGGHQPDHFIQYLTYAAIRNKTYANVMYDDVTQTAYIDTFYQKNKAVVRIWFDDEHTLSSKYDFVLQNGLGGVGFSYFGYDGSYGELRDVLLYKFIAIDSSGNEPIKATSLSFLDKIKYRFSLYHYILHNPCSTCFDSSLGMNAETDSLHQYIQRLGIDTAVTAYNNKAKQINEEKDINQPVSLLTTFTYLTKELNHVFFFISLFLLLLLLVSVFFYIYFNNRNGERWRYKKPLGWTILVLSVFFFWGLFDYLFTNSWIPFFGISKSSSTILDVNGNIDCTPSKNCINIPVNTLLEIILLAGLIGFALTRYLISPLLKREEIP